MELTSFLGRPPIVKEESLAGWSVVEFVLVYLRVVFFIRFGFLSVYLLLLT